MTRDARTRLRSFARGLASWAVTAPLLACHAGTLPNAAIPPSDSSSSPEESDEADPNVAETPLPPHEHGSSSIASSPEALAREGARELAAMRHSHYQHRTEVDEETGQFNYDCSGFVGYALRRIAPRAYEELVSATVRRPLAKHFEAFFAELPTGGSRGHWMQVAHVDDLHAGDVIAWSHPPVPPKNNTGHTLLVRGEPTKVTATLYAVPVEDSTSRPHGDDDSRASSGANGLGTGTIELETDENGAPIAYLWGKDTHWKRRAVAIAFGRVVP